MYIKDYKEFAERENFTDKLNQTMTNENIEKFLNERLEGLSSKTQEDYIRGFSSLTKGMEEKNINTNVEEKVFNDKVIEIRNEAPPQTPDSGRYIENLEDKLTEMSDKYPNSAVVAEIQAELGVRASEALELASNPAKYIEDGKVNDLVGKGNHKYHEKDISDELVSKIENMNNVPSYQTYRNHCISSGIDKTHDLRVTYVKNQMDQAAENGILRDKALVDISKEINHKRGEITEKYLSKA
jgi:hypothetical protein